MLFGGFSSTKVTQFNVGSTENPYFEKLADLWQIWPYSQAQGPDSHMQSGASPGSESSVGDTNDWILFLCHFDYFLSLFQIFLTPGPKHSKTQFWTENTTFGPINSPENILIKMRAKTVGNGIAGCRGEL